MVAVGERIRELAKNKIQCKRSHNFNTALDPVNEYDKETIGWLELDNGFMWFTDPEVYQDMASQFQVTPMEIAK
jgi:hypothetical protein